MNCRRRPRTRPRGVTSEAGRGRCLGGGGLFGGSAASSDPRQDVASTRHEEKGVLMERSSSSSPSSSPVVSARTEAPVLWRRLDLAGARGEARGRAKWEENADHEFYHAEAQRPKFESAEPLAQCTIEFEPADERNLLRSIPLRVTRANVLLLNACFFLRNLRFWKRRYGSVRNSATLCPPSPRSPVPLLSPCPPPTLPCFNPRNRGCRTIFLLVRCSAAP